MYITKQKNRHSEIDILINDLNSESKATRDKSKRILKMAIEKLIKEGATAQ